MITISIDTTAIRQSLDNDLKQCAYATATAINSVLVLAQTAQIAEMQRDFTIRRQPFLKQSVKIQFAKKTNLTGTIGIMNIGSSNSADIFSKFEDGGTKTSSTGGNIAIPASYVRPSVNRLVPASKKPKALTNAFKIRDSKGDELLMVRVAKGKYAGLQVAYVLEPSVPIRPRLHFYDTVLGVIEKNLQTNMDQAVAKALATAR